uniref:Uncharacterized protein n=1 Tax=Romanomermis culicivorax TaxID=13658 RepID=A0A915KRA4_ROMCU
MVVEDAELRPLAALIHFKVFIKRPSLGERLAQSIALSETKIRSKTDCFLALRRERVLREQNPLALYDTKLIQRFRFDCQGCLSCNTMENLFALKIQYSGAANTYLDHVKNFLGAFKTPQHNTALLGDIEGHC